MNELERILERMQARWRMYVVTFVLWIMSLLIVVGVVNWLHWSFNYPIWSIISVTLAVFWGWVYWNYWFPRNL